MFLLPLNPTFFEDNSKQRDSLFSQAALEPVLYRLGLQILRSFSVRNKRDSTTISESCMSSKRLKVQTNDKGQSITAIKYGKKRDKLDTIQSSKASDAEINIALWDVHLFKSMNLLYGYKSEYYGRLLEIVRQKFMIKTLIT